MKKSPFLVVDIETKKYNTQERGFTRPFLIGVYDGNEYKEFRNESGLNKTSWQRRHDKKGGCVDKVLNYMLQDKYKNHLIYAHNGGNFDYLFWLNWLKSHDDEYEFEVTPVQTSIKNILVSKKNSNSRWTFLDSIEIFESFFGRRICLYDIFKMFSIEVNDHYDLNINEYNDEWTVYLKNIVVNQYACLNKIVNGEACRDSQDVRA